MGCLGALFLMLIGGAVLIAIGELFFKLLFGAATAVVYIVAGGIAVVGIIIIIAILYAILSLFKR